MQKNGHNYKPSTPITDDIVENDRLANDLRGFGIPGIIVLVIIIFSGTVMVGKISLPLGAILVLIWTKLSLTPWSAIGYTKPRSWFITIITGIAFGVLFKLFMKALIMPLLGADSVNQSYNYLVGNNALLPFAIWAMLMAGFGEETVFRGFLFERLSRLFGKGSFSMMWTILITSTIFGLGHYFNQGWWGVLHAAIFGVVFGIIYARTKQLFMLMIAHASFDLAALVIIYYDLEKEVAELFFK